VQRDDERTLVDIRALLHAGGDLERPAHLVERPPFVGHPYRAGSRASKVTALRGMPRVATA